MPGPPRNQTKPNSRAYRGTSRTNLVELPAAGCTLPVPRLPRGREWTTEEKSLWRNLWHSPQANAWDDSYVAAVAGYVCHAQAVYSGAAAAWQAQEFRHLGSQLGLTPQGMAALGWTIK